MNLEALLFTCLIVMYGGVQSDDDVTVADNRSKSRISSSDVCPKIRFRNGRVKIRSRGRVAKFSCSSGFEMVGKRFSTCVRGQWNNPPPICVAAGCASVDHLMNGQVFETYSGAMMLFECNPGYILRGSSNIYCDGFNWNTSIPTCEMAMEHAPLECDFESEDLCGWTQDPLHDFDWRRQNFGTPSGHVGTGPSHDHTKGEGQDGYYMYIEASSPRKENDTARLFSPVYTPDLTQNGCFIFWYHMYGATSGYLRVLIKPEPLPLKSAKVLFIRVGDQGNRWLRGTVPLPDLNENFQIIIEGARGSSYVSDTAIDDLKLTNMTECLATEPPPMEPSDGSDQRKNLTGTCAGRCLESDEETEGCQCNSQCQLIDACCLDYAEHCEASNSVNTSEPLPFPEVTSSFQLTSATSSFVAVTQPSTGEILSLVPISSVTTPLPSVRTMDSQLVSSTSDKQTVTYKPEIVSSFASAEASSKVMVSPPVVAPDLSSRPIVVTLSPSLVNQSQSKAVKSITPTSSSVVVTSSINQQQISPVFSSSLPKQSSKSPSLLTSSIVTTPLTSSQLLTSSLTLVVTSTIPTSTLPSLTSFWNSSSIVTSSFSKTSVSVISSTLPNIPEISLSNQLTTSSTFIVPASTLKPSSKAMSVASPMSSSLISSFASTQNFILSSPGYATQDGASVSAYSVAPDKSLLAYGSNSTAGPVTSAASAISTRASELVTPTPAIIAPSSTIDTKTVTNWTRKARPSARATTGQPEVILLPESSKAERQPGLSTPAVAGVAAGVLVLLLIVGAASYRFYKHRQRRQDKLSDDSDVRFLKDGEVHMEFSEPSRVYNDSNM